MKNILHKYNHIWTILYILIYMPWFVWLEQHVTTDYHVIYMPLDDIIPFCEYFIIPYFLWFLFVPAVMIYEFFYSKKEFYQASAFLFIGMTLFLLLCTLWPNGLQLRQDISYKDNICADLVRMLYKTDTSTNVFPSIHVFNTLGCLIALLRSKGMKEHGIIKLFAAILSVLIILSTVFLKQHSVWDVIGGFGLALIMYLIVYAPNWEKLLHRNGKLSPDALDTVTAELAAEEEQ